jgi:antitoxin component YwqK of YwqJK toxin-antitoxin module
MKNKPITFLLSLTFLFLFIGFVYGEELGVKRKYYFSGKLRSEAHYKNKKREGLRIGWYKSGKKSFEGHYKNDKF